MKYLFQGNNLSIRSINKTTFQQITGKQQTIETDKLIITSVTESVQFEISRKGK